MALMLLFCRRVRFEVLDTVATEVQHVMVPLRTLRTFEPASEMINFPRAYDVIPMRPEIAVEALPLVDVVAPWHVHVGINADRRRALTRQECRARGIAERGCAISMAENDAARRQPI